MSVQALRQVSTTEGFTIRSRVKAIVGAGMKLSRIAIEIGVRLQELESWFESKDASEKVEQRLAAWLEDADRKNDEESEPGWVETETALEIMAGLEIARKQPTIALVYGGAGLGKTASATRYVETCTEGKVFRVNASVLKTRAELLRAIFKAVHGGDFAGAYRCVSLADAILERAWAGDLLIIDEAQRLDADALDGARYLFDEAGLGVAYVGNEAMFKRIGGQGRSAEFAQLHSRVGYKLHLTGPRESDIDAILEAWGVSGSSERGYAQQIAQGPGGLRTLTNIVRGARLIAKAMKEPVSLLAMREASTQFGIG